MDATFEPNGEPTPETRAAILAEYLRLSALQTSPIDFGAVYRRILINLSADEEQIGADIYSAHFMACGAGLVDSTTLGSVGGDTKISASAQLRTFVWAAPTLWCEDEVV